MADQTGPTGLQIPIRVPTVPPPITGANVSIPLRVGGPDVINYAAPTPMSTTQTTPAGVPTVAGVDAQFAAVPGAPTRVTGGFASQADALEYANQMHAHNHALKNALTYAQTAKYLNDLHHETAQHLEAGDFLTKYSGIRHDDPDYEQKVSKLLAEHPNAGGHPAVAEALQVKHAARQNNFAITNQKKDQEDKVWNMLQAGAAGGFLSPQDFSKPGEAHPELGLATVDKEGNVNLHNALMLLAARQSTVKNERGENAQQRADRADFDHYNKEILRMESADETTSPDYKQAKEMLGVLGQRIAQRDYSRIVRPPPANAATTAAAPGPAAAPAAPSVSSFLIRKPKP